MTDRLPGGAPVGRRVRLRLRGPSPPAVVAVAQPRPGSRVQRAAASLGAVFVLVGLLGFLPGLTVHFGGMSVAGHDSSALLLGVFKVSVLHNVIHLLIGVVGIALARKPGLARVFLLGGGAVYLVLGLVGRLRAGEILPVNTADNWLHTVLGAIMVALGLLINPAAWRVARRHG